MKTKTLELQKIFRCVQLLQQRNRLVGLVTRDGLNILEMHFLVEVSINPYLSPSALAEILCIEKTLLSRVVVRFIKRGLINIAKNHQDKRQICISITETGKRSLKLTDSNANTVLDNLTKMLTKEEVSSIAVFFNLVADIAGVPKSQNRYFEHPLRSGQRRITRALGILRNTFSLLGFGASDWHVLNEIFESGNSINAQTLSSKLSLAKNTVSQIIRNLVSKGYLLQKKISPKSNSKCLIILDKGIKALERSNYEIIKILDQATKNFNLSEIKNTRVVLEKFIGYLGNGRIRISNLITAKLINDQNDHKERDQIRSFAVKSLFKLNLTEFTPAMFFHESAICIAFYEEDKIVAAGQIENKKSSENKSFHQPAITFYIADKTDRLKEMPNMLKTAIELLSEELGFKQAEFEFNPNIANGI